MNKEFTFDIKARKKLIKDISKLSKIEQIEIFKIFKKDNIKYTENSNGIFINISKINDNTLSKIKNFITFYKKNNKELNNHSNKIKELENNYFKSKKDYI